MKESHEHHQDQAMAAMKYTTFAKMIVVGTAIMFGLMYLNTYAVDHIFSAKQGLSWHSSWVP